MAEDFNSKYTGEEVENLLDQVASGDVGGGTAPDLSQYATKTELERKVDKVDGKQLSTEDFTTILKQKLDGLSNYDDTEISEAVNQLREDFDTLVSGDSTTAIKTFNEIIAFLSGIEDSENLDSIIASIEQQIAAKVDTSSLAAVALSGSFTDLNNVSVASTGAYGLTILSDSVNSTNRDMAATANAVKKAYDLAASKGNGTVTGVKINDTNKTPDANGVVDLGTVITAHQDISGKQDKLVSGTNIKSINGASLLGSGNIAISGGGSSDKVEVVGIYPVVNGDEWTYQIPAGKFVELWAGYGSTAPSCIYLELLDPVEATLESEDDWAAEYSKYHFVMFGDGLGISWVFRTNTNQNATPDFIYNSPSATGVPYCLEFDILCALIHYPASTGYPDYLFGYMTMAPLNG